MNTAKKMKNRPSMRKWVIIELIFYFLCIMKIYATPKELTGVEWFLYMIAMLKNIVLRAINSDLNFAFFSVIVIGAVSVVCFLSEEFRQTFLERIIELKKEITGEALNEEWADEKKLVREKIFVGQGLDEYVREIKDLCKKAGICEVNFIIDDSIKADISSVEKSGQPPVIMIKSELFSRMDVIEPVEVRTKLFRFILSHELIHVKYHDSMNKLWLWRFYSFLWMGGLAVLWNGLIANNGKMVMKILLGIILIFWCFFCFCGDKVIVLVTNYGISGGQTGIENK